VPINPVNREIGALSALRVSSALATPFSLAALFLRGASNRFPEAEHFLHIDLRASLRSDVFRIIPI
jgi:hypothetical protein